jgi:hypothetical protein
MRRFVAGRICWRARPGAVYPRGVHQSAPPEKPPVARVELSDSWTVPGDVETVRKRLLRFFKKHKMKVVSEEEGEFHSLRAKQGSQLWTRLLGGWFVSAATLPKQALVKITSERPKEVRLLVSIEESLGFGILDPILAKKYENYFDDWMSDLDDALAVAPDAGEPDEGIRDKPPKKRRET